MKVKFVVIIRKRRIALLLNKLMYPGTGAAPWNLHGDTGEHLTGPSSIILFLQPPPPGFMSVMKSGPCVVNQC